MTRQEIKTWAKEKIKNGNMWGVLGVVIVTNLITGITAGIETDNGLISLTLQVGTDILTFILAVGLANYMVNFITDQPKNFELLFSKFKYWKSLIKTWFWYFLRIFLWTLALIVPGIIKAYAYSLVPYILNDNPEMDSKEALELSERMMDGHKGELFVLQLSFIGWELLGILTFGILYLWIIPYAQTSQAKFLYEIKTNYEKANTSNTQPASEEQPAA